MRRSYATIALTALVAAACPYDHLLTSNGGLAIGGGGGGGSGPDALAFTVQPSSATAGNIITPAIQVLVRDSLGIPDSAFAGSITMSISVNPVGGRLSGDRLVDAENKSAYYMAHVAVSPASLGELRMQAGMPAEVYVRTDSRTVLDYLLAPVTAYLRRAMREPL